MNLRFLMCCLFFVQNAYALNICTACDSGYFKKLLNFVGSLHQTNFDNLSTLAVYNLGLTEEQINQLNAIEKVEIREIRKVHPDILKPFRTLENKYVAGWYAWKPVAIKQELEIHPTVLWIDAGSTICNSLVPLFKHVEQNGYFLATIGVEMRNGRFPYDINWQTTSYVRKLFSIKNTDEILRKESVTASPQGVSRKAQHLFIDDLYSLAHDLKNYADDGTAPGGFGCARHDQALLGIIAYQKNLQVFKHDPYQKQPMNLLVDGATVPFYMTWQKGAVNAKTCIYQSKKNISNYDKYVAAIHYKEGQSEKYKKQSKK